MAANKPQQRTAADGPSAAAANLLGGASRGEVSPLEELFRQLGKYTFPAVLLATAALWILAHTMSEPCQRVSVLWGMVEYSKACQGEGARAAAIDSPTELPPTLGTSRNGEPGSPEPRDTTGRSNLSFDAYLTRLEDLDGRYLQRDEFFKSMVGSLVSWRGFVDNVSPTTVGDIIVIIRAHETDVFGQAVVSFPTSEATRLFALQKDDIIEVEAMYLEGPFPVMLQGQSFSFPSVTP